MKQISIKNAHLHNLKQIDVTIPKNKLVVVTGVSGSGKSSLVFDILFEEGRKQYLQAIGVLSGLSDDNGFDSIRGIGPTVAVKQSLIRQSNPRSVVGTKTKLLTYLAMLYLLEGETTCVRCGASIKHGATCLQCGQVEEKLTASYFSFNSLNGMCLECEGKGTRFALNLARLVPHEQTTLRQMLTNAHSLSTFHYLLQNKFEAYADRPFREMPEEARQHILYGVPLGNHLGNRQSHNLFEHLQWKRLKGKEVGETIKMDVCPACQGYRVGEQARRVTLNGKHIGELGQMEIEALQEFLREVAGRNDLSAYGNNALKEISSKIRSLMHVGLGHLTLYRETPTLSGGELQRLFLMSHLDSEMESLIYILDEPTIGLHELEKGVLLEQIRALQTAGNTVILVEHDRNSIEQADYVLDVGPLAGAHGGEIVYHGAYQGLLASEDSITGQFLAGRRHLPRKSPDARAKFTDNTPKLTLLNAQTHNLRQVTVDIPLGMLVGIAGVSGSGKSSLITDTLVPLLQQYFDDVKENLPPKYAQLIGAEHLTGYAEVSQAPIGRQKNSHPASYLDIWEKIRQIFAQQPLAIERGYAAGHFSFHSDGGCTECSGSGEKKMWLGGDFFVSQRCPECHGNRYQQEVLDILVRGKSIADVLNMSVSEAAAFFEETAAIRAMLRVLERIGMGYITLGQPAPTLSGGESQRVKLAKELGKRRKGNILYILDEPTTGLSFYDIEKLLLLLDELLAQGHSVLLIEHDPNVLSYCDWLIELGPGGGRDGGYVIAQGAPEALKRNPTSKTGAFLL
ncbi:excision endonuclease subunit UvrA [Candidatus Moduliflexus flocculans]|uniref:UvrABC system protein A n=1 Tax=Candidatus Moduliflexus flocculans TaxID=1499966 RepID=A0A0S6VTV4_9BACT|nr:excision endonuclease subunit UvrA [Candidatus Moduliflexus flocculans]